MKKTPLQKKWEKIESELGWVSAGPEAIARAKDRNQKLRAKKEARFTTRLNQRDFDELNRIAERMGLGYQTLIGSIIHQYVTGELISSDEVKKVLKASRKVG